MKINALFPMGVNVLGGYYIILEHANSYNVHLAIVSTSIKKSFAKLSDDHYIDGVQFASHADYMIILLTKESKERSPPPCTHTRQAVL